MKSAVSIFEVSISPAAPKQEESNTKIQTTAGEIDTSKMETADFMRYLDPKDHGRTSSHSPIDKRVTFGADIINSTKFSAKGLKALKLMYQSVPEDGPINLKVSSKKSLKKLAEFRERGVDRRMQRRQSSKRRRQPEVAVLPVKLNLKRAASQVLSRRRPPQPGKMEEENDWNREAKSK